MYIYWQLSLPWDDIGDLMYVTENQWIVSYQLPFLSIAQPRQNRALSWTSKFSTEVRRSMRNKSPPMSLKYSLTKSEIEKVKKFDFINGFKYS